MAFIKVATKNNLNTHQPILNFPQYLYKMTLINICKNHQKGAVHAKLPNSEYLLLVYF